MTAAPGVESFAAVSRSVCVDPGVGRHRAASSRNRRLLFGTQTSQRALK